MVSANGFFKLTYLRSYLNWYLVKSLLQLFLWVKNFKSVLICLKQRVKLSKTALLKKQKQNQFQFFSTNITIKKTEKQNALIGSSTDKIIAIKASDQDFSVVVLP